MCRRYSVTLATEARNGATPSKPFRRARPLVPAAPVRDRANGAMCAAAGEDYQVAGDANSSSFCCLMQLEKEPSLWLYNLTLCLVLFVLCGVSMMNITIMMNIYSYSTRTVKKPRCHDDLKGRPSARWLSPRPPQRRQCRRPWPHL